MKPIEELLENLKRPEVSEFGLVTNRLPSVNVNGRYEPVDTHAPTSRELRSILVKLGGRPFVDDLGASPVQWTLRLEGVGVIAVAALARNDVVQARFTVARREPRPPARPPPSRDAPSRPPAQHAADDEPTVQTVSPVRLQLETKSDEDGEHGDEATKSDEEIEAAPPTPFEPVSAAAPSTPASVVAPLPDGPPAAFPRPNATPVSLFDRSAPLGTPIVIDLGPPIVASAGPGSGTGSSVPSTSPSAATESDRPRSESETLLDDLLGAAVEAGASDVHVLPQRPAALRVAGKLVPRGAPLATDRVERLVRDLVPARLRETFDREGACVVALNHPAGRFRVGFARGRAGVSLTARSVPRVIPPLAIPEVAAEIARLDDGLVLVVGGAGQGKTTTLASLVDRIAKERATHIVTIEDPIEFIQVGGRALVRQREVGTHTRCVASAVRAALREDANVIAIGDLAGEDALRATAAACEAGCLVLATVSGKPPSAIEPLVAGMSPYERADVRATLSASLRFSIFQRLEASADERGLDVAFDVVKRPS